jgi:CheY-like chemotaxis protein
LRTPLTIVQGYAELLRDGELGTLAPEQQQALFVIVDRACELRTLVDRIGVLMALEANKRAPIPLELVELVVQTVKERQPLARQSGLTLSVHLEQDLPLITGDPYQLQQALDSLLENAIKFTPGGGRIDVKLYTEPDLVCIAVCDSGIGIPEDKLPHLFSGFYQADGSTTRHYGGIGLGLTIAKAVIEAHGGRIEATSLPNQGSQFVIKLPLQASAAMQEQPAAEIMAARRILVVDDEENVALTLQDSLEKLPNYQVVVATSGEEALRLCEQQPFDLLITDYKMPGMDGMTLATQVRQLYPLTAIVMVTAYSSDELREQAARASIQRILGKPVKLAEVRSAALEVLDQPAR